MRLALDDLDVVHSKPVGMPSGVAQLCHQCLQPDPANRLDFSAIVLSSSMAAAFETTFEDADVEAGTKAEAWPTRADVRAKRESFMVSLNERFF